MESHAEFLRLVTLDDDMVARLRADWRSLELSPADQRMLAYAEKVTADPASVRPQDLDTLRDVGFTDQAILQINLITSFFNYVNRVADGLGIGRGPASRAV